LDSKFRYSRSPVERAERLRSPSNGSNYLTLDTPFRQISRHHTQRPPTTARVGQDPALGLSSPLSHLRLSRSRGHINPINSPGNNSVMPTSATPNMSKEYGRRPRHKTRLDRYEPKDAGKSPKKVKKRSDPKRSHRRLPKTTVGEGFKAPNVKQDRLTVRTSLCQTKYLSLTLGATAYFWPWVGTLPEWENFVSKTTARV
jgi:hypothetical protein